MSAPLTLVFCGTPAFAVPTLEALAESGFAIPLVVTQPDKPRGRGLELALSPIKIRAQELGLPVAQPDKIKNNESFRAQLQELNPDAIIVVGYGRIVPQWMIDLPRFGNLNLHASLLPKYRGAAPIQWAIASGETMTGVTTMRIDAGLDTGDILLQEQLPLLPDDTSLTVAPRLASIGARLMVQTLDGLRQGTLNPVPQDNSQATLAPILKKEDGQIVFERSAMEIYNRLRAFQPWPGAFTSFRGKTLQVWSAKPVMDSARPAELICKGERLLVGCAQHSSLELLEIQLEGKKRMPAKDFIHGYHLRSGERLGV